MSREGSAVSQRVTERARERERESAFQGQLLVPLFIYATLQQEEEEVGMREGGRGGRGVILMCAFGT